LFSRRRPCKGRLARHGSISAAARELHIAVGAASKRISDLEDTLKVSLLNRFAFGVELTPAGKICFEHASRLLLDMERMYDAISDHRLRALGTLRIAAVSSALLGGLLTDLDRFMKAHVDVRVELEELTSREVVEAVTAKRVDIGFCVEPVPTVGLNVVRYRQEKLVVLVRADHALAKNRSAQFVDTLEYVHTGLVVDTALADIMLQQLMLLNKSAPVWFRARSFDTMCYLAETTNSVAILDEAVAERYRNRNNTVIIELNEPWAILNTSIIWNNSVTIPLPASLLLNMLKENTY